MVAIEASTVVFVEASIELGEGLGLVGPSAAGRRLDSSLVP